MKESEGKNESAVQSDDIREGERGWNDVKEEYKQLPLIREWAKLI